MSKNPLVYKIEFSGQAGKALGWIVKREPALGRRIAAALEGLAKDPFQGKSLKGELKGRYSYRIGSYRILYRVFKNQLLVIVIDISHRRDIY